MIDARDLDAPAVDARDLDAPAVDARDLDAPAVDARDLDAPAVDARDLDAPVVDARELDAGFDAPALDASTSDAPPVTWPSPVSLAPTHTAPGYSSGLAASVDTVVWAVNDLPNSQVNLFRNGTLDHSFTTLVDNTYVVTQESGEFAWYNAGVDRLVHELGSLRAAGAADSTRPLVGERAGGILIVRLATSWGVARLRPDFTFDPDFGAGGVTALPGNPDDAVAHGTAAAPLVTLRIGGVLTRLDSATGQRIASFGVNGDWSLPFASSELLALAPQPGGGLVLVQRDSEDLVLHTVSAAGGISSSQRIYLGAAAEYAKVNRGGVMTVWCSPQTSLEARLVQVNSATGALVATFGTGGRFTVTLSEGPGCTLGGWRLVAVRGDGRTVLQRDQACPTGVESSLFVLP